MSLIDLAILGFLKRKSMSAYELAKFVEFIRMKKWMKIGSPTIYQNIKKLAANEYLSTETVKEGNMPEKVIYSLTESGEDYFLALMERFSEKPGKIYFGFNTFIINLHLVDKDTGLEMLNNLQQFFYNGQQDLERDMAELQDAPLGAKALMKQYQIVFDGMIQWIEELIKEYQAE
ncbi:PadR family transcriptional regulator [Chloroflexota bacterium]